jgi:HAD superfamily hydrolase (TIGR01509 family)
VLSYELGLAKPDRAIFEAACQHAGVPPEATAFFDDVPAFVEGALAAGMKGRVFRDVPGFEADLRELGLR